MSKKLLITGGASFIGSAVIRHIIENDSRYTFEQVDICNFKSTEGTCS